MKQTDKQRLEKIIDYADKLMKYLRDNNIDRKVLMTEYSVQWAVTTPLYNIGEHVYHLSEELKGQHDEIPWMMISGLRHRLVHDYDGTNWSIIVEVVFSELPEFAEQVRAIYSKLK